MIRKYIFLALLLIFLSSCTPAKSKTIVPPTTIAPTYETLPSSTLPIPTKGAESSIVILISGTVKDISLSTRVITLNESVNDFNTIAVTEESELAFSNGSEITLRDIQPGMTIQITGQPGESNALLANQVLVLNSTPITSNKQSNDQQIDAINTIRTKLDLPELPLEFIGTSIMANSPNMNLEVALYEDTDGRKYSVNPRTNIVIEIDARSILLNISPDTPLMPEEELESRALKYILATTPDSETLQADLMYEYGNKEDMYFFSWYDNNTVGLINRPFAQVGLHKRGVLFAYYNTLSLAE